MVSLRVEAPRPVDVSPEAANMLEKLCLAQAQEVTFEKFRADGKSQRVPLVLRIDTPIEVDYYAHGGILPYVLRQLLAD